MTNVGGRVREVERLLQVVTVLRAGDGYPVPRKTLQERVPEYRQSLADEDSVKRMMANDRKRLAELGFQIEDVAAPGEESTFLLKDAAWRLPLELGPREQGLLLWVMAAAGAIATEVGPGDSDLSNLLGAVPRGFDLAQAAIAGRRSLVVEKDGEDVQFHPALLASRQGRWFLLGRYGDQQDIKAPRLDRLDVQQLGPVMDDPPQVAEPDLYLDTTYWDKHEERVAQLRCKTGDLPMVASWFARAAMEDQPDGTTTLALRYRNEEALITRVIGLAGSVWIEAPTSAVTALRDQVTAVLEETA